MQVFTDSLLQAWQLSSGLHPDLLEIFVLSMQVSGGALLLACVIGLPVGAYLAIHAFWGRGIVMSVLNALMGMPPVVVGLLVYVWLSRSGPLGWLGLLYTPTAMVIAQVILILPIVAALSCQIIENLHDEYAEQFQSLSVPRTTAVMAYLYDARFSLCTVVLAGFGRAISEVGAVIIVGGNIDHLTRVMTTTIALETAKGNLSLALALGVVLLALALTVNALVGAVKNYAKRRGYA